MKVPQFNFKTYPENCKAIKGGTMMNVGGLADMTVKQGCLTALQMYSSGSRMTKDTADFSKWNGCAWIDIDYKNWINYWQDKEPEKILKTTTIYFDVVRWMAMHLDRNFYYSELSRHGNGFHFIFYFDGVEGTASEQIKYKCIANAMTYKAFVECGYKEIIDFEADGFKVFDTCANSLYQMMFLSGKEGLINNICDGKIEDYSWLDIDYDKMINEASRKVHGGTRDNYSIENQDYIYLCTKHEVIEDEIPYIEHVKRWTLFESLSRIYKDEELRAEWTHCAKMIPERNGHTTDYYIDCPYTNDWNERLNGDEFIDRDLMRIFGYEVTIKKRQRHITDSVFDAYGNLNIL